MSDESVYVINIEGRNSWLDVLYEIEKRIKPVCYL